MCPCYNQNIYIHTYIHTYIYTHIHTYIHTYTHTYICTHTHTHTHTQCQLQIHISSWTQPLKLCLCSDLCNYTSVFLKSWLQPFIILYSTYIIISLIYCSCRYFICCQKPGKINQKYIIKKKKPITKHQKLGEPFLQFCYKCCSKSE